ncbi:hypothetical protein, partial [Escherichia coli]|uniref:hypothetical protein n=1 Tax=Escherichia coli TaxID=562 RepID=UPI001952D105
LDDIDTPYESSILRRFYASFVPESVGEAQQLERSGALSKLPADRLLEVWTLRAPPFDDPYTTEKPPGIPLFGPLGDAEGREELRRLRQCVLSIRRFGY